MRRAVVVVMLGALSACVGFNIRASSECADLCDTLAECGFLPSSLGWAENGDPVAAQDNCESRCGNTPTDDPTGSKILSCLAATQAEDPAAPWCEQSDVPDDAGYHDEWEPCARIAACLDRNFESQYALGDVAITVQLMTSVDYDQHLAFPVSSWPPAPGESDSFQSCQPALCDRDICRRLECSAPDCESTATGGADTTGTGTDSGDTACSEICEPPEGILCDTALCRIGKLTISAYCDEMGIDQIIVHIYGRDRLPAVDVLQDVDAGINSDCAESTIRIDSDLYRLSPGPVMVVARIAGELVGASLKEIGYFDFPSTMGQAVDEAAATAYCIEMLGPAMTARAGENTMVVPLGDLAALKAREVVWRPCS